MASSSLWRWLPCFSLENDSSCSVLFSKQKKTYLTVLHNYFHSITTLNVYLYVAIIHPSCVYDFLTSSLDLNIKQLQKVVSFFMWCNVISNLKKTIPKKKPPKSFIADAQATSTALVSSYYPSVRSSATSLEEEVILSLLGLPSDLHKSSSGMNL